MRPANAGTGTEVYIFPTVEEEPSSVSEEYGLEPGLPQPLATNKVNAVTIGITGTVRSDQSDKFPITISTIDVGAFTRDDSLFSGGEVNVDTINAGTPINELLGKIRQFLRSGGLTVPVSRFNVTSGGVEREVDPNIRKYPAIASSRKVNVPTGYTVPTGMVAPMLEDDIGNLWIFYIAKNDSNSKYKIFCYKLAQKYGPTTYFGSDASGSFVEDELYGSSDYLEDVLYAGAASSVVNPSLSATIYQGEIYVLVVNAGQINTSPTPHVPKGDIAFFTLRTNPDINPGEDRVRYISGPIQLSPNTPIVADGGCAFVGTQTSVAVAIGAIQDPDEITARRVVLVGRSVDMRNWNQSTGDQVPFHELETFSSQIVGLTVGDDNRNFNDIHFSDADGPHGWAVTSTGEIWHTSDQGKSWAKQTSPVEGISPLRRVFVAGIAPPSNQSSDENDQTDIVEDQYYVYIVGDNSTILRSQDSGQTWKVLSSAKYKDIDSSFIVDETKLKKFVFGVRSSNQGDDKRGIGDVPLYGIYFTEYNKGWICGARNTIVRITDATQTPTYPDNQGFWQVYKISTDIFKGDLFDISVEVGTPNEIWVAGDIGKVDMSMVPGRGRFGIAHFHGEPITANAWAFESFTEGRNPPMFRIFKIQDADTINMYFCGARGSIVRYDGTSVFSLPSVPSGTEVYSDIHAVAIAGLVHKIYLVSLNGLLAIGTYNISTNVATWRGKRLGVPLGSAKTVELIGSDMVFVGAGKSIFLTDDSIDNRGYPNMCLAANGNIVLACCNTDKSEIETWLSSDNGISFVNPQNENDAKLTFPLLDTSIIAHIQDMQNSDWDDIPRPCLAVAPNEEILLIAGESGLVSTNHGTSWLASDNKSLPMPLGSIQLDGGDVTGGIVRVNRTAQVAAYGGLRIFMSIKGPQSGQAGFSIYSCREWRNLSVENLPIPVILNVPQWTGVDDLRVIFTADPSLDDAWTIPARYRFSASNVNIESPSTYYRTAAASNDIFLEWSPGSKKLYNVTAGSVFNTNFRYAEIQIAVPSYDPGTPPVFPGDGALFTRLPMWADIENSIVANILPGAGGNILIDGTRTWIPGQFSPGNKTYYVQIEDAASPIPYRILNNSRTALILDVDGYASPLPVTSIGKRYVIYGDRLWTIGEVAQRNNVTAGAIIDTDYQYASMVRLVVPRLLPNTTLQQIGQGGYAKLGTAILGIHTPLTYIRPDGEKDRIRFSRGFRWNAIVNTIQEQGISGVTSIEHFGRSGQVWLLPYEDIEAWQRDVFLAGIGDRLRRAFAMVFDSDDRTSLEIVRYDDSPENVNTAGDNYSYTVTLREVI